LRLGAQEAVAGAFVDVRFVGLVQLGHVFLGRWDRGINAGVVAAIVALHGGFDSFVVGGVGRGRSVINDGSAETGLSSGIDEACPTAPAEADAGEFAAGGGKFDTIVVDSGEVGCDL